MYWRKSFIFVALHCQRRPVWWIKNVNQLYMSLMKRMHHTSCFKQPRVRLNQNWNCLFVHADSIANDRVLNNVNEQNLDLIHKSCSENVTNITKLMHMLTIIFVYHIMHNLTRPLESYHVTSSQNEVKQKLKTCWLSDLAGVWHRSTLKNTNNFLPSVW